MAIELDPNNLSPHTPGAKLDANKPNCDLVFGGFANALLEVAKVGTFGAAKYTDNGWKQVPNGVSRYRSAAYRHLLASEFLDKDSSLPHLAHAAWNCLAALQLLMDLGLTIKQLEVCMTIWLGKLSLSIGLIGRGDNGEDKPWFGFYYGSWYPHFEHNGGCLKKGDIIDINWYWLCLYGSFTYWPRNRSLKP